MQKNPLSPLSSDIYFVLIFFRFLPKQNTQKRACIHIDACMIDGMRCQVAKLAPTIRTWMTKETPKTIKKSLYKSSCGQPPPKTQGLANCYNGGLSRYRRGEYDTDYWECTEQAGGTFVRLKGADNSTYVVPIQRVNKALRGLEVKAAATVLHPSTGACRCTRTPPCYQRGFSTHEILQQRHAFYQPLTEQLATEYLASLVRPFQPPIASSRPPAGFIWRVCGTEVCGKFFALFFGISRDKLQSV